MDIYIIIGIFIFWIIFLYYIIYTVYNQKIQHNQCQQRYPIKIGISKVHQRGVFATQNIKRGDLIELIPIVINIKDDDISITSILNHYIFEKNGIKVLLLGYGSLYNHNINNNAEWSLYNENMAILYATKDIYEGDEIFVNYGKEFINHPHRN